MNDCTRRSSARHIRVIGIGAGSPEHVTAQAATALAEVDVFLVADKGDAKDELVAVRRAICDRFIPADHVYEFLTVPDPTRGPDADRDTPAYTQGVQDWHAARTAAYVRIIEGLPGNAVVGFLVWGDPAFYDSTIRVVEAIGRRIETTVRVIPGISAFQTLAAAHGVVLHRVGEPVHITTGRRLVEEWTRAESAGLALGSVVVMLDAHLHCRELTATHPDTLIHWGAYVGMPQQELRSGRLADVIEEIVDLRARLRRENGWIMDVYALTPS